MNIISASIVVAALALASSIVRADDWHTPIVNTIDSATQGLSSELRIAAIKSHKLAPPVGATLDWLQYQLLIASAHADANQFDQADQILTSLKPLLSQINDPVTQVNALIDQGFIEHIRTNNSTLSCGLFKQAYEQAMTVTAPSTQVRAISKHAYCLSADRERAHESNELLNDALAISRDASLSPRRQALLLSSLAQSYTSIGMLNDSLRTADEAIRIYRLQNATADIFNVSYSAATAAITLNRPDKAEPFIAQLELLTSQSPQPNDFAFFTALIRGNQALATSDIPLDVAKDYFEQALALQETTQERVFVQQGIASLIDISLRQQDDLSVANYLALNAELGWNQESLARHGVLKQAMLPFVKGDLYEAWRQVNERVNLIRSTVHYNLNRAVERQDSETLVDASNYIDELRLRELEIERLNMLSQKKAAAAAQQYMIMSIAFAIIVLVLLAYFIYSRNQFKHLANTDNLTLLANRRRILAEGEKTFAKEFVNNGAAIVLIDIDHFKSVNDSFGHQTGDELLKAVASTLQANLRPGDHVGRYGGEEFLAILSNISRTDAMLRAEQIRSALERDTLAQFNLRLTASIGICHAGHTMPLEDAISIADKALYQAKQNGRNQVAIDDPVTS